MSLFTPVPTNMVLTSGANSALTWTNAMSVSSISASTLSASALSVSTLTTSSSVTASTLTTTSLNYSSIAGSSISSNTLTLSLTNASTQNTQIYQVATTNPTTSYTVIQASHVSTGTTNNALALNPSGGNVGVGTTAPVANLNVIGNTSIPTYPTNTVALFQAANSAGVNDAGIMVGSINGNTPYLSDYGSGSPGMLFYTNKAERMRILANGNVGIGTTAPIAPLHVTAPGNGLTSVQYAGGAAQWYTVVGNYPTTTGSVLTIPIVNQGGNWSTTMFRIRGFNGRYNNSGAPLQFTAECATVTLGTGQGGVTVLSIGGNTASVTFNQSSVSLLINFTTAYGAGAVAVVIEYLATLPSTTVIPASISAN